MQLCDSQMRLPSNVVLCKPTNWKHNLKKAFLLSSKFVVRICIQALEIFQNQSFRVTPWQHSLYGTSGTNVCDGEKNRLLGKEEEADYAFTHGLWHADSPYSCMLQTLKIFNLSELFKWFSFCVVLCARMRPWNTWMQNHAATNISYKSHLIMCVRIILNDLKN